MPRTTSSLWLSSRWSLRVATTVPTTLASSMGTEARRVGGGEAPPTAPELLLGLPDGQHVFEVGVRPRNHVHRDKLAYAACGGRARIGCRLHCGDVASHDGGHVACADLLP